jgi:branched-chain amino acid transport system substrate-binding protein
MSRGVSSSGRVRLRGLRAARTFDRCWLVFAACLVGLLGCGRMESSVGILLPVSGRYASQGEAARRGVMLAWEQLPPEQRPPLVFADGESQGIATGTAFGVLADQGATVVLGPLDGNCARAASVVARIRRVPCLSPSATLEEVTRENSYALCFCVGDRDLARRLSSLARHELRLSTMALVVDLTSRQALNLAELFGREFHIGLGRVVGEVTYYHGDDGLGGALDRVAEMGVDGVLLAGHHDDVLAMLEGATNPRVKDLVLLGPPSWEGVALEAALDRRGIEAWRAGHFHADEQGPEAVAFVEAFLEAYGEPPSGVAALAYDAAQAVFAAFDPDLDGSAMRDRLLEIQYFVGATGIVHMDSGGRPRSKSLVLEPLGASRLAAPVQRLGG